MFIIREERKVSKMDSTAKTTTLVAAGDKAIPRVLLESLEEGSIVGGVLTEAGARNDGNPKSETETLNRKP